MIELLKSFFGLSNNDSIPENNTLAYILIQFTEGLSCQAYQVIDNNQLIGYVNLDGSVLVVPNVTGSHVIDALPAKQDWM